MTSSPVVISSSPALKPFPTFLCLDSNSTDAIDFTFVVEATVDEAYGSLQVWKIYYPLPLIRQVMPA